MPRALRTGLLFLVLVIAAIFVLFPFFWMVATSLKEEGKGLSFEFLPATAATEGPFTIKPGESLDGLAKADRTAFTPDSAVRFAWHAPEANAVEMRIVTPEGPEVARSLARGADGTWTADAAFPSAEYTYSVTVHRSFRAALGVLYTWSNFKKIALNTDFPFLKYLRNSFLVAFTTAFFTVLICALAAYVFAKKRFRGRLVLFWLFMGAMMVPGMMYMVPQFALVTRFGWINSLAGLVIPHLSNVFGLFMLKQMMEGIPDSLFEAARIDGAGEWTVFTRIVVPLSLPSMAILFLLTFVGQWNNFLWQLLVNTPQSDLITLPVGLSMFRGQYANQTEQMMAASTFSLMPIVILFLFTQRFLIEGLTAGGVKE